MRSCPRAASLGKISLALAVAAIRFADRPVFVP
jgi:hypothetical protein